MINSSSFESPKSYLIRYYLKNSITALLRYVILAQSTPISLHTEGFVPFVSLSTVPLVLYLFLKRQFSGSIINPERATTPYLSYFSNDVRLDPVLQGPKPKSFIQTSLKNE